MADQKLTELTLDASPQDEDLRYTVKDPSGTPLSRSTTLLDDSAYFKSKLLAGTDNRLPRFDTPNGVQASDWEVLDTKELLPITAGNNLGSVTKYIGEADMTNIYVHSSVSINGIQDRNSSAKIVFDYDADNTITLTPNTDGDSAFVMQVSDTNVYCSATDFAAVDGGYSVLDVDQVFLSWYDVANFRDNYFKIDSDDGGIGVAELNVKFTSGSRNGMELAVLDNIGVNRTSDVADAFPMFISTRNTTINSNVKNSAAIACSGHTVTADETLGVANIDIQDAKNIILGTATGTQIGTAASQKLGFLGATPIIQQTTTSQTAATFVANTSGIADDTATWAGYTVGDVVAILQAYGLIA